MSNKKNTKQPSAKALDDNSTKSVSGGIRGFNSVIEPLTNPDIHSMILNSPTFPQPKDPSKESRRTIFD